MEGLGAAIRFSARIEPAQIFRFIITETCHMSVFRGKTARSVSGPTIINSFVILRRQDKHIQTGHQPWRENKRTLRNSG